MIINALLIPRFHSTGAAIGTVAAELVVLIIQYMVLRNELRETMKSIHYLRIVLGIVLGSVLSIWVVILNLNNFLTLLCSSVLFFGGYGLFMLLMKEELVIEVFNQCIAAVQRRFKR